MKKKFTIKDIARELNISTSTVSRALSNSYDVSDRTKELVRETAKKLNYKPNNLAVNLKSKRTKTIGLIVPEFVNSFFPTISMSIQQVLEDAGYLLLITQCGSQPETERRNIELLLNNNVEGIIMSMSKENCNENFYKEVISDGTPIVFFNRVPEDVDAHRVVIDDMKVAFFATEHLINQGYEKIFHFAGPGYLKLTSLREGGFRRAMKKHKLNVENSVFPVGLVEDDGYDMMVRLVRQGNMPRAIFCFNDPVAAGTIKALNDSGYKVPDDVAIVGFTETKIARLLEITSVCQPLVEMGETVARLIIQEIEDNRKDRAVQHKTISLNAKLNIRASSINKMAQD